MKTQCCLQNVIMELLDLCSFFFWTFGRFFWTFGRFFGRSCKNYGRRVFYLADEYLFEIYLYKSFFLLLQHRNCIQTI